MGSGGGFPSDESRHVMSADASINFGEIARWLHAGWAARLAGGARPSGSAA